MDLEMDALVEEAAEHLRKAGEALDDPGKFATDHPAHGGRAVDYALARVAAADATTNFARLRLELSRGRAS